MFHYRARDLYFLGIREQQDERQVLKPSWVVRWKVVWYTFDSWSHSAKFLCWTPPLHLTTPPICTIIHLSSSPSLEQGQSQVLKLFALQHHLICKSVSRLQEAQQDRERRNVLFLFGIIQVLSRTKPGVSPTPRPSPRPQQPHRKSNLILIIQPNDFQFDLKTRGTIYTYRQWDKTSPPSSAFSAGLPPVTQFAKISLTANLDERSELIGDYLDHKSSHTT